MSSSKKDSRGWLLLLSVIVIAADRITKWLASTRIELGSHVVVIAHVFAISHVENPGAAFSLFNDSGSPDWRFEETQPVKKKAAIKMIPANLSTRQLCETKILTQAVSRRIFDLSLIRISIIVKL